MAIPAAAGVKPSKEDLSKQKDPHEASDAAVANAGSLRCTRVLLPTRLRKPCAIAN